jgi:predicted DNA-binding transcriptional regulator YafY
MRGEYQLPDQLRIRRVVRKVSNTFWFLREVMQYGEDCEIISPESLRKRMQQKANALWSTQVQRRSVTLANSKPFLL